MVVLEGAEHDMSQQYSTVYPYHPRRKQVNKEREHVSGPKAVSQSYRTLACWAFWPVSIIVISYGDIHICGRYSNPKL
jgi:hypothetical protein